MTLNFITNSNKEKVLIQTTHSYVKAYHSIIHQYKELSEVIFTGLLNFTKVDERLYKIQTKTFNQKEKIRQELYLQTIKRFNLLKKKKS
ncbi:hypothetical protein [Halarcobacter anaerophilus]|uniref:hypothetical protein n=1 Tax=Halarcobacter anaerophilus TaxID=877500 RepID=UPI0005CA55EB|nr:hypothetical protein [Halarcobacter anaerophilus]